MKQVLCAKCKKRPAMFFVTKVEGENTTQEGLCIKCAMEMNIGPVKQIMQSMGISEDELEEVSEQFEAMFGEDGGFEPGGAGTMPFLQNFGAMSQNSGSEEKTSSDSSETKEEKKKKWGGRKNKEKDAGEKKRKYLSQFCTDLTAKAKSGKVDRIIGRENEIYRAIQILCRRQKNNPCFIGEPGVGKTAIAEGLALKISNGDVPAKLKDKEIHMLDLAALVAGTQFRGQFESRIKGLVEEVRSDGNIILFIDEVHSLVGTGDAEGSMNAANILKPSLSRGEIQIIGATTFTEYRKYIEKDAALERRLQPIRVEEPSIEQTAEMLKGIKDYYEDFHRVRVTDTLIEKAVMLSERYINDRFLPDKAIDLLDEACTCANLRNKNISNFEIASAELADMEAHEAELMEETEADYEEIAKVKAEIIQKKEEVKKLEELAADNNVTEDDLARVIQLWTGIPASKVIESDLRRLSKLEDNLKAGIIGQDEAISLVSAAVRRGRVQINPRRRPASFIFVGPTGVGKTELVKLLAKELFETPETLIRLDMSEFMEKHSVSRIIGSPPGYVGYDEAGQLTEKVRRKPYSVVLFDEIEKAHPDVMNILLQILDEGRITDAQGRNVSFENTVIVMTSNAGSNRGSGALGFAKTKSEASKERAMKALNEFLRPEFIGRVDEVVVFNDLTQENYEEIAVLMLKELVDPMLDKGITFTWDDAAISTIARLSVDGPRGARDLRNTIRRNVEDVITEKIVNSYENPVKAVKLTAEGDKIICNFE
ncbi:MAG: ATP-dependent Clp protease ATP-binding subunit [Clostridia bacterium]|nr:ATP-dependent Clp protease ATP-binding subunit [Clostridia bacterium]